MECILNKEETMKKISTSIIFLLVVFNGLIITGGSSSIRGLVLNPFSSDCIQLNTIGGNVIEGNFIGTDTTGTAVFFPNSSTGIAVVNSTNNTIGGSTSATRNL